MIYYCDYTLIRYQNIIIAFLIPFTTPFFCLKQPTPNQIQTDLNAMYNSNPMADIIKVKARKHYDWNQDPKYLYVQIPLPSHTSLKKVDIFLSDLILRVTTEKKQTHFLDLLKVVEYRSPDNKFVLTNGLLHATLRKVTQEQWPTLLLEDISLAELKNRRRESELRYQQSGKQAEEVKDKLRTEYDRKATQEMMRFQQEEREKLQSRKQAEKDQAIREVFTGINEQTGRIERPQQKQLQVQREDEKWKTKERLALQMLAREEENEKQGYSKHLKQKTQSKIIQQVTKQYQRDRAQLNDTMFSEEDINKLDELREKVAAGEQEEIEEEIPVRRGNNQKVAFTQRPYPNLAARDTFPQAKEPPMPKSKNSKQSAGDLQSKNPLWLKDKGDSFFRDKNYTAAIEAYTQAVRLDGKLTKAFLNRSLAHLKLFRLQDAINDCDQCLVLFQAELPSSEEEKEHSRVTLAKIKARKAICLAWKGELTASRGLFNEINQLQVSADIKSEIQSCLAQIQAREQSLGHKVKGDQCVRVNDMAGALGQYQRAILIDHNEYALSNKVLCLNKTRKYEQAISTAAQTIKKLNRFNLASSNREDKESTLLLLKLHYRKAKAHEELGQIAQAEEEVRKGLTVSSEDKDMKELLAILKKKQTKEGVKQLKESAASLVKQAKVKQALQAYGKCLKLLQQNQDVMQYLAILQNQCVCYQKLQQFDDVLSTCIRILKLANTLQSKVLGFGGKKEPPVDKEELRKISVRTLMRRANAYVRTGQLYNAKSDFERALEINQDEQIKKELERLYEKLKTELQG